MLHSCISVITAGEEEGESWHTIMCVTKSHEVCRMKHVRVTSCWRAENFPR